MIYASITEIVIVFYVAISIQQLNYVLLFMMVIYHRDDAKIIKIANKILQRN